VRFWGFDPRATRPFQAQITGAQALHEPELYSQYGQVKDIFTEKTGGFDP